MRIVSLLPSATEIVASLGLVNQLVGVTHECDWPTGVAAKLKVTRTLIPTDAASHEIDALVREQRSNSRALYSLDFEQMCSLNPDLIVTQTLCDVCAVDDREVRRFVSEVSQRHGSTTEPKVVYLEPTCLEDVLQSIVEVAEAAGVPTEGMRVVDALRQRIERVRLIAMESVTAKSSRPRVVVLEWLDPLFSCGHWTPELVEIAGGIEPLAKTGARSRQISMAQLVQADPDVILIACCGFSIERTMQDVPAFLNKPEVASLRCVRSGRVLVTDGSAYFSRPGPRLVESLEILAHAVDPVPQILPGSLQGSLLQLGNSAANAR